MFICEKKNYLKRDKFEFDVDILNSDFVIGLLLKISPSRTYKYIGIQN